MPLALHRGLMVLTVALLGTLVGCREGGDSGGPTNLFQSVDRVRDASARMKSQNNLKQIMLSFHNHEAVYQTLPTASIMDKSGKPLLSWRVTILPYIDQGALFKQFKLDEPWDSAHNKALLSRMPEQYRLPVQGANPNGTDTHYRLFVSETPTKSIFQSPFNLGGRPGALTNRLSFPSFVDGTSNTILVVEAEEGVPWTKPEGIPFDGDKPLPKMPNYWNGTFNVGFADGSVRAIPSTTDEKTLKTLIGYNDGIAVMIP